MDNQKIINFIGERVGVNKYGYIWGLDSKNRQTNLIAEVAATFPENETMEEAKKLHSSLGEFIAQAITEKMERIRAEIKSLEA